jgi:hypothetical protein
MGRQNVRFCYLGLCAQLMAAYVTTLMQLLWPHNHPAGEKLENLMATDNLEVACFPYALGVTSQIYTATGPFSG